MKKFLPIILIIILGAVVRLWMLGQVPQGISNDEMGYIFNSYSIAKTGKNVFGEFLPLFTWINRSGTPFMPVPIYISVPFFWIFDLSPFSARLPSAILGIVDIYLIYILAKKLFKNESIAIFSSLFLSISPWHIFLTRTAYDFNFGLFFYLLGITLFIHEIEKRKLPLLSFTSFFLAIYSYRGMNLLFPALFLILLWFAKDELKAGKKLIKSAIVGFSLIIFSIFIVVAVNGSKYTSEATRFYDKNIAQQELDKQIREAKGPLIVRKIFFNKPTFALDRLRENYIESFSPNFLFLQGEATQIYSIWSRGKLYFVDLFFILFGVYYLLTVFKRSGLFVVLLLFISALPASLSGQPFASRNFFMVVPFSIITGAGMFYVLNKIKLNYLKLFFTLIIAAIYIYVFSSFLFDYYGRFSYYSSEVWFKSLKDISLIIEKNKNNFEKVYVGTSSFPDLLQYAFYSKQNPVKIQKAWAKSLKEGVNIFKLDNTVFTQDCSEGDDNKAPKFNGYKKVLYIVHDFCAVHVSPSEIVKDYFGNTVWKVYRLTSSL